MRVYLLFLLSVSLSIAGCSRHTVPLAAQPLSNNPDYSDLRYWAAHPGKWDPSDSVPADLRSSYRKEDFADVFFVYPTSMTDNKDLRWNATLDDAEINQKTDSRSILYQASAFNEQSRVYAPRYRQAHLRAFYTDDKLRADSAFEIAYQDVKKAFEYYMKHDNNGRPIIIAAHSQGTVHAARLLKEFFEGKPLMTQLVAAYLIGMPVSNTYFKGIPACSSPRQTGCVISWRSFEAKTEMPAYIGKEPFTTIVTNPLTWTTGDEYAPISLNKGAVLRNFNQVKAGVVDAQKHGNVLWVSKPKFFGNFLLRTNNYHIGDINFFYLDIMENLKERLSIYRMR